MARTSQQTYIQRLGFQDRDRSDGRHGLACEYLFDRLVDTEFLEPFPERFSEATDAYCAEHGGYQSSWLDVDQRDVAVDLFNQLSPSKHVNVPITGGRDHQYVNGFADVLLPDRYGIGIHSWTESDFDYTFYGLDDHHDGVVLGEVKITPEPAENICQQISFYSTYLKPSKVVILVDYHAPGLKRMTVNSQIEVYRLGQKFDDWMSQRTTPEIEEF